MDLLTDSLTLASMFERSTYGRECHDRWREQVEKDARDDAADRRQREAAER